MELSRPGRLERPVGDHLVLGSRRGNGHAWRNGGAVLRNPRYKAVGGGNLGFHPLFSRGTVFALSKVSS
jgi:hypothetical protein